MCKSDVIDLSVQCCLSNIQCIAIFEMAGTGSSKIVDRNLVFLPRCAYLTRYSNVKPVEHVFQYYSVTCDAV